MYKYEKSVLCFAVWQHMLETALLSASQELSEQTGSDAASVQSLIQQRDVLQNGLLSTCRELSRVSAVSIPTHTHSYTHITFINIGTTVTVSLLMFRSFTCLCTMALLKDTFFTKKSHFCD